ncbi:hypothetical protein [Paractinoplanes hotanensis]|uniref:Uncharacterized protein n=1 Tax=Paractinoplanes hotanensis TaxID=2906497 RepID=A0ABT0YCV5_9ACTN|nr:hypothetical protein [Actinoplanes hotanensis]MCM4083892.1 hypothetical protein [Actinoplanes hotanensis]
MRLSTAGADRQFRSGLAPGGVLHAGLVVAESWAEQPITPLRLFAGIRQ